MRFLALVSTFYRAFFRLWLGCVWSLVLLNTCAAVSKGFPGAESDRLALLALKYQLEDSMGALGSWNDSLHHCDWPGITCSPHHRDRVAKLDLHSLKLRGILSPFIGNLTFLESLTLSENTFLGELPEEIGHLIRLQELSLNDNSFVGEIPKNLTHCSELTLINLIDNKLYGKIPGGLSSLSKLAYLGLAHNDFSGSIPSSLGNLTSLLALSLAKNRLDGSIPEEICHIQNLSFIQLSENNLTGTVPPCLYNLRYLYGLSVASNHLEGSLSPSIGRTLPIIEEMYFGLNKFIGAIPVSLSNATRLSVIAFDGNYFTGSVPMDLGKLHRLEKIYFNDNLFGTEQSDDLQFITSLTNCSNLYWVEFQGNHLNGPLPDTLANLSKKVQSLEAGDNHIRGSIPAGIGNFINIQKLNLQNNRLSGNIPFVIGRLDKLIQILLQGNRLSGEIPSSLGNLTQITHLYLGNNSLSGSIPTTLGQCQNLNLLNLSHNNLVGTIPKQVIGLPSLTIGLHLQQNSLSGPLPPQVGELINCVTLDISENRLTGLIPDSLGRCLNLRYLSMGGNSFEGAIPVSLSTLNGLQYLDLSRNKFSVEIPEYLENFPLSELNLSFNEFEGFVPHNGVFQNVSSFSVDGNKNLCGGVEELKLKSCSQKKENNSSLKVIIPTVGGCLCLIGILVVFLACYKGDMLKRKSPSTTASDQEDDKRISYAVLHAATDGFSAGNLIGLGSHGSIYKGFLSEFNRSVAVKVFNFYQREASKSFLRECNTLRYLRHHNLVKILTVCSSMDFKRRNFYAIVFDFMSNGSLEDLLDQRVNEKIRRVLTFTQTLGVAMDIASAIDYLHNFVPAVVHCDLKPSNILFDDDMVARVSDFGIAKTFSATSSDFSQSQISSFAVRGTIGYVAPEYGLGSNVSTQGDVYSYGILLLEMFTKKKPTDNMFQDGLCLHNYAVMLLQHQVSEVQDSEEITLLEEKGEVHDCAEKSTAEGSVKECLASVIRLGVACSAESPVERPTMREVVSELCRIKDHLHQEA